MSMLTDAVMQSVISNLPNAESQMARDYLQSQIKEKSYELIERKASLVEMLEQKISAAKERNADAAVIGAYEKLLAQAQA